MKNTAVRRIAATVAATAIVGSLTVLAAAPANAQIKAKCVGPVCIAADIVFNTVKDATVSVTDGRNADLHIFIGGDVDRWKYNSQNFKTYVNKVYDYGTLVCGEAWAGGHLLGRPCVKV
ncbi:MAG: hypothetical protein ACRDTC_11410 [Pseudonocardiaceae bacterium]